jgi:hypothetical protein
MTDFQACWQCKTTYPQEDLRGLSKSPGAFYGRICVQCRLKESLKDEIRKAQGTLQMTQAVAPSLDGWKPFEAWASSQIYNWHIDMSASLGSLKVFTKSHSRSFAFIWLRLGRWYGGIASLSSDGQTLAPVEMRWGMGGYISPVSAAAHALYYLGSDR